MRQSVAAFLVMFFLWPAVTQAQDHASMKDLLGWLPDEAFYGGVEEIGRAERVVLIQDGESETFLLTEEGPDMLRINNKYAGDNFFRIRAFPIDEGGDLVVVYTANAQSSSLACWQRDPGSENLHSVAAIPPLQVNEFFLKKVVPDDYKIGFLKWMDDEGVIRIEPNTWMNSDFEGVDQDYEMTLRWNGEGFEKIKTAESD